MDSTALSRSDSIVLIPTYNEKENIAAIIHAVFELPRQFHILIIDNNSPDGTGAIVQRFTKTISGSSPPHGTNRETRARNSLYCRIQVGYRTPIRIYFRDGRLILPQPQRRWICGRLQNRWCGYGYRFPLRHGVNVVNWPMGRVMMSYFASKYVRFVTGMKIHRTRPQDSFDWPTSGTQKRSDSIQSDSKDMPFKSKWNSRPTNTDSPLKKYPLYSLTEYWVKVKWTPAYSVKPYSESSD